MDWTALWLTTKLALVTSLVLLVIGVPLAWWLATTAWRGRIFVEAVVALPIVLPPTVIGFYVLVALGPRSPVGRFFEDVLRYPLPFTFAGLVVASALYSLPFAVQPFVVAFRGVNAEWIQAAWATGATPWRTFRRVTIPLAWPGLLSGVVLSFAHTLGEFGVVLMVGGNIAGETRTISVSIYDAVESLDYATATRTALLLVAISFAILSLIYLLQRNVRVAVTR